VDSGHWAFDQPGITVWIALDDVEASNGCTYSFPGSHATDRRAVKNVGPGIGAFLGRCPDLAGVQPVASPVPAGGAVFHHSLIVHGAAANMGSRPRRALTVALMPLMPLMPGHATYNGRPFLVAPHLPYLLRPVVDQVGFSIGIAEGRIPYAPLAARYNMTPASARTGRPHRSSTTAHRIRSTGTSGTSSCTR
jgi:hypothetical protein